MEFRDIMARCNCEVDMKKGCVDLHQAVFSTLCGQAAVPLNDSLDIVVTAIETIETSTPTVQINRACPKQSPASNEIQHKEGELVIDIVLLSS